MGRPLRLKAEHVTYHITSRTNGKKLFMKKKADHKALCHAFAKVLHKYDITCYGFTPMSNHFHLIIHIKDNGADLSQFMCEVKTAYAKYFNFKYNTSGHFWGDRFKSTIIEDEPYMLACLRYIDRNPLNAGLVSSSGDWHLGSYNCYAKGCNHPILPITLHPTFIALSHDQKRRYQAYIDFVDKPFPLSDDLHGRLEKRQFLATPTYKAQLSFS